MAEAEWTTDKVDGTVRARIGVRTVHTDGLETGDAKTLAFGPNVTSPSLRSSGTVLELVQANGLAFSELRVAKITAFDPPIREVLVSGPIFEADETILAYASAPMTLTLPDPEFSPGRRIVIKDAGRNSSTFNITIQTSVSGLIEGGTSIVFASDGASIEVVSDGQFQWFVI